MVNKYALVKNGVVQNVIVADESFAEAIESDWDYVIRVDQMRPYPGPGWVYEDSQFKAPVISDIVE